MRKYPVLPRLRLIVELRPHVNRLWIVGVALLGLRLMVFALPGASPSGMIVPYLVQMPSVLKLFGTSGETARLTAD